MIFFAQPQQPDSNQLPNALHPNLVNMHGPRQYITDGKILLVLLVAAACVPASCRDGHCLTWVSSPTTVDDRDVLVFQHDDVLPEVVNGHFQLKVVTTPTSDKRPFSHAPLWIGCNPTQRKHHGISIGHRTSRTSLEVRIADGTGLESVEFPHHTVPLHSRTERRVNVYVQTPPMEGRRIDFYLNNTFIASRNISSINGDIYIGTHGALFGDVWDWKFRGVVHFVEIQSSAGPRVAPVGGTSSHIASAEQPRTKQPQSHRTTPRASALIFSGVNGETITWQNDVMTPSPDGSFRIHLCGLQRTGTNLLTHLLNDRELTRRGLWYKPRTSPTNIRGTPPWKHFHIFETSFPVSSSENRSFSINHIDDYDKLLQTDKMLYVVAVKDPFAWFVSVCKFWSKQLSWFSGASECSSQLKSKRKSRRARKAETNTFIPEYLRLYNNYYTHWLKLAKKSPERVVIVKYEDVLNDCNGVLAQIRSKANISVDIIKPSFCLTRRASPSYGGNSRGNTKNKLWDNKKEHYMTQKYLQELFPEDIREIAEHLDSKVAATLSYSRNPSVVSNSPPHKH